MYKMNLSFKDFNDFGIWRHFEFYDIQVVGLLNELIATYNIPQI